MRELGLSLARGQLARVLLIGLSGLGCSRATVASPSPRVAETRSAETVAADGERAPAGGDLMGAANPESAKGYDDTTKTIEALVGERFVVRLPANITTPYKWALAESKPRDVVALAERHYQDEPPPDCSNCVGYPGTDCLTFEATAPGTQKLTFRYQPIGSRSGAVSRELVMHVNVKQK